MIRLLIAFILPFQVFVVAPFTFYFGNRAEINLSFQQVLIFLGFCFFVFSVFFYVALLVLEKHRYISRIFIGFLVGVGVSVWVQSQILAWDFGPLDGREIIWSNWYYYSTLEVLIWTVIIFFCVYFFGKSNGAAKKSGETVLYFIFCLGFFSIATSYFVARDDSVYQRNEVVDIDL